MKHILEIHEDVFEFLIGIRGDTNSNLLFTLRRSNREARLDEGYWFYGNDDYLAVSFCSGTDWKNRTPNIIFVILPSGETFLEFNVSDSDLKREFVQKFITSEIRGLMPSGRKFFKQYSGNNYLESLREFLVNDKNTIDFILKKNVSHITSLDVDDRIWFIDEKDFNECLQKVEQYRRKSREETFRHENVSLNSIVIRNYGKINHVSIGPIDRNVNWIFLTGENGSGKTSILRAIALTLTNAKLPRDPKDREREMHVECRLYDNRSQIANFSSEFNELSNDNTLLVDGFAAYGPSRLISSAGFNRKKASRLYSLFNHDGTLLDLCYKIQRWRADPKHRDLVDKRLTLIKEVLYELVPNVVKIDFVQEGTSLTTRYTIDTDETEVLRPRNILSFDQLASGAKSLIAMLCDMMARLFDEQSYKTDPSELVGVVLIDEIDVHLHPKWQKELIEQLSKTFPAIQFIVTTHSPIPLLGAPRNSRIYNVTNENQTGVNVRSLDYIKFSNLLPNTLLTSPVFGLYDIKPVSNEDVGEINVDDTLQDTKFFELVRKKLDEIEKGQRIGNDKYFDVN